MSYTIKRWNGLITTASVHPQPVVYITPDVNLLSFSQKNNNTFLVKITGTNLPYDDKLILASMMPSSLGPGNCRPNFFKETGLYAIVLSSEWYGQPEDMDDLGFINIVGLNIIDGVMSDQDKADMTPVNAVMASKMTPFITKYKNIDILILSVAVMVFVGVFGYILWRIYQKSKTPTIFGSRTPRIDGNERFRNLLRRGNIEENINIWNK